jgi:addiction module RelE/StbE family toxin
MKNEPHIEFSSLFQKQRQAAPLEIKQAFRAVLELFASEPTHPALRNHRLSGKYQDFRSVDITEDYRALYREEPGRIIFVKLGTHEELYG